MYDKFVSISVVHYSHFRHKHHQYSEILESISKKKYFKTSKMCIFSASSDDGDNAGPLLSYLLNLFKSICPCCAN